MVEANHQDAVGGEKPNWKPVPADLLSIAPYAAICQIVTEAAGGAKMVGTGWLAADGVVMTAAHLFANDNFLALTCKVYWPKLGVWQVPQAFRIHPEFRASNGGLRVASGSDVAKLQGFQTMPGEGLAWGVIAAGPIELAGFRAGVMVRGVGAAKSVAPFVGHSADALNGHSGAPLLAGGKAVGIHVSAAYLSRQYLPSASAAQLDTLNSAVALTNASGGFPLP